MKESSMMEGVAILAVLIVITLIVPNVLPKGSTTQEARINSSESKISNNVSGVTLTAVNQTYSAPHLPYSRVISLGLGNARYAYQPYQEYVTITNKGKTPIDITGWQLKNGKDKRGYELGGRLQNFSSDIAIIPQGTLVISPRGPSLMQNVILQRGEKAIVTTGRIANQSPYNIVSFKENMCSGYLGDLETYTFTPRLSRDCPRPADEPGVSSLTTECRKFIERMSPCRQPEFETRDKDGEICINCVNGKLLSSSCVAFIKDHFNYGSCVSHHKNDPDFSSRTWRIFLGKGWEMWAQKYETMELFDSVGGLVDSYEY